ncbi:30S ribosomal protein S16 [bacterium]|jgi:small subunit ribosomal protein S16|nr:30S ribosomal protein S16 [bacterium]
MVVVRLKRGGAKRKPCYRVVVAEQYMRRDGRNIEEIGFYHPCTKDQELMFKIKADRLRHYLDQGASMSQTVASLVKKSRVLEASAEVGE